MAFVLNSLIKIGGFSFVGVHELEIKKNVHVIVDTAKLKIPGKCNIAPGDLIPNDYNFDLSLLKKSGSGKAGFQTSVNTALNFSEGDPVVIYLGYNGDYKKEFQGFVRRVNLTTPILIEMEGYAWQLRNQNILQSWPTTTVKAVLQRIIQGTDIVLSPNIPDVPLTNFHIRNQSGLDVLEYLKHKALLTVYFIDNMLYAGIEEGATTTNPDGTKSLTGLASVKYKIGYNCISNQPDLKQRLGKDNLVRVRLVVRAKTGKRTQYEAGDPNGAVQETVIPYLPDGQNLKDLVAAKLKRLKYDGLEGKLIGFLQPFCLPGWQAVIDDQPYSGARTGTYFIWGTTVTFGVKGARRNVEIGYKLDAPDASLVAGVVVPDSPSPAIT